MSQSAEYWAATSTGVIVAGDGMRLCPGPASMVYVVHMTSPAAPRIQRKLSASQSVGFRAGEDLRRELFELSESLSRSGRKVTISDILREGMTAFWPQIQAYMRATAMHRPVPADTIRRIVNRSVREYRRR